MTPPPLRARILSFALLLALTIVPSLHAELTWTSTGMGGGGFLMSVAYDPTNADVIYVGGDVEGLFKSTDGGQSWAMKNGSPAGGWTSAGFFGVQEIVVDPSDPETVYACTWSGLWKSTDGADSWSLIYPGELTEETPPVAYVAVDPANSDLLFLGVGDANLGDWGVGEIHRSSDGGDSWELLETGIDSEAIIHSLFIDPSSPVGNRTIYAGTGDGVWKSMNGGDSWSSANNGLPHTSVLRIDGVVVDEDLTLYLSIQTDGDPGTPSSWEGGLYRSLDDAANWQTANGNLPQLDEEAGAFYDYWKFAIDPTDPLHVFAGTRRGETYSDIGCYVTTDGGHSWNRADEDIDYGYLDLDWWGAISLGLIAIAPSDPDRMIMGIEWLATSQDGGESWQSAYTSPVGNGWDGRGLEATFIYDFAFDADNPDRVYMGYDDMGLWRSDDAGESYLRMDEIQDWAYDCAFSIAVDSENDMLYVGRCQGGNDEADGFPFGRCFRSPDNGETMIEMTDLPEGRPQILVDPQSDPDNRVLYAAIYNHGVFKSEDGGVSWSDISAGLGDDAAYAWAIALDPHHEDFVFVGTNTFEGLGGTVYRSSDGGGNWNQLANTPEKDVLSVALDPFVEGRMYIGTTENYGWTIPGGGLYRSDNLGQSWDLVLDQPRISDVEPHPSEEGVLLAISQTFWNPEPSVEAGVWVSRDSGSSWTLESDGLEHTFGLVIKVDPHNPDRAWYGSQGGGAWIGSGLVTSVPEERSVSPSDYRITRAWPNPFNSGVNVSMLVPATKQATLRVYDLMGREVTTLFEGTGDGASRLVSWQGQDVNGVPVASGSYFLHLEGEDGLQATRRVQLVR